MGQGEQRDTGVLGKASGGQHATPSSLPQDALHGEATCPVTH